MLFNSLHFLIFFPIVIVIYFCIPHKYRWILLLFASYYFYMSWKAEYVILILISTIIDYFVAIKISREDNEKMRKIYLLLSIITNIGLLISFKYLNFISSSVSEFLQLFSIQFSPIILDVLLPVGISFYTFQTLSYTIDVYRRRIKPERHFGIFAVYVSFFPQLVAGPIERGKNLLPQFLEKHYFDYIRVTNGLKLMLWGFFKKIVIADRLAVVVNAVYNNPTEFTGAPLILATVFFAFQIYCDFSGYSDIAIGTAQVMGYNLMDNFKRPYFAGSISEFWQRWHISLSTWFRDYLYIPLGGSRVSIPRWYFNLIIIFIVSGFWHGANWTFLVWGGLHGFYLIFSIISKNIRFKIVDLLRLAKIPKLHKIFNIIITFSLICVGWIFFRANSLADAFYIIQDVFLNFTDVLVSFSKVGSGNNILQLNELGINFDVFVISVLSILFLVFIHFVQEHVKVRQFLSEKAIYIRWPVYIVIIFAILLFGIFEEKEFIYFQF